MAIFDFVITTLDSVVMVRVSVDMILDSVVLILNVVAWIGNSRLLTQWIFYLMLIILESAVSMLSFVGTTLWS